MGDDELKICDQGRFKPQSFLQETGNDGQHQPRIGNRPQKSEVQDARRVLAHLLPFFLSSKIIENQVEKLRADLCSN